MYTSEDVYSGNKASDYQPPTQNPQSTTTNIQPGTSNVQPTDVQSDIAQQRLPAVDNLKVIVIQDGTSTTRADLTPVQKATQTWVGPFWGCVLLGTVILMIWVVRILAKEEVPNLSEAIEEAIKEPIIEETLTTAPIIQKSVAKPRNKTTNRKGIKKKKNKKK